MSGIPIAAAIKSLRHELSEALSEGEGQSLKFDMGEIELTFQVEVSRDAQATVEGKGGIKFGIVSLGEVSGSVDSKYSNEKVHTIKMTLNPVTQEGKSLELSGPVKSQRPL